MIVESSTDVLQTDERPPVARMLERYRDVRSTTRSLCEPLEIEDFVVQSMEDASPTRWHIAHTTWFFETFVLDAFDKDYKRFNDVFPYLFNSYYVQAGERFSRPRRGMLTRPTVSEVLEYREYVDRAMQQLLEKSEDPELYRIVEIGLNHEQQHQELILTDLKHMLSQNPLWPVYTTIDSSPQVNPGPLEWTSFEEGLVEVGTDRADFHFDNEGPRHRVFLESFYLANRLVTNAEYIKFIEDGGYQKAPLWLSEGWALVESKEWSYPPYWVERDGTWFEFTLGGLSPLDMHAPVSQVSYFEADAFARWAGYRLPTESEWEYASASIKVEGNFVEDGNLRPLASGDSKVLSQMFGDLWEWTRSQYSPYPGYQPEEGALGEYNGKFMSNQFVLRGGSFATSKSHIRRTYRNFFPAYARWQFTGIRLAK